MLSIVTPLRVLRVNKKVLEHLIGITLDKTYYEMNHCSAVELVAELNGEDTSFSVLCTAIERLGDGILETWLATRHEEYCKRHETYKNSLVQFELEGQVYPTIYQKATVVRHFHLFRDFFAEYPTSPVPCKSRGLVETLGTFLTYNLEHAILKEHLESLQVLNPVSDAYYLQYDLLDIEASFVDSCVRNLTEEEKNSIMRAREVRPSLLPLPSGPYQVLAALPFGANYLITESGMELLEKEPCPPRSWLFCILMMYRSPERTRLATRLVREGFNDTETHPDDEVRKRVVSSLLNYLRQKKEDDGTITPVLSMLGLVEGEIYAPYQVTIDFKKAQKSPMTWETLRAMQFFHEIPNSDIERSLGLR